MNKSKILLLFIFISSVFWTSCSKDNESINDNNNSEGKEVNKDNDTIIVVDLSDEQLLDFTQRETFKYFWDYAEKNSLAARERYIIDNPATDEYIVTTGGTGFQLMSVLVAIERGFISRQDGYERIKRVLDFFETADRFHGAWPHWLDGRTGKVRPFSQKDNGGDLVETAFFAQGLIAVKQYYQGGSTKEIALSHQADSLWEGIEWNWYTNNENVLYWHWSPDYDFQMNLKIEGFNECLITYILAASSPSFPISKNVYTLGWARNSGIRASQTKYNLPLVVRHNGNEEFGGPLFWSQYSFLGLNPVGLVDEYVDYEDAVINHSKINFLYCIQNPKGYSEYGKNCWGLTASYSRGSNGNLSYAAHSPSNDLGIISPTAAISAMPFVPEESMRALKYFYHYKAKLLGPAGFYDAFSPHYNFWVAPAYLAIDQGPIIIMIENHRTGLLWNLFMADPEIKEGLKKLGFQSANL